MDHSLNHQMIDACDPRPLELRRLTLSFQFLDGAFNIDEFFLHDPAADEKANLEFFRKQREDLQLFQLRGGMNPLKNLDHG